MNKDQLQFLVSGILFGFLVGYTIAYAVHEPRTVDVAAPVPAAGNLGMGERIGAAEQPAADQPAADQPAAAAPPGGNEQVMGRVFEEIRALKDAIAANPRDVQALVRLANMYHDAGKYDEAVGFYRKALDVEPKNVDARTDMGICLREQGKSNEAIAEFRTSLTYEPRHWQSWLNLAVVSLFDTNDLKTASEALAKVEALNPTFKDLPLLKEELRKRRTQ